MTNLRQHLVAALILTTASMQFTGCKSSETPTPTVSVPAEKTPAPPREAPACHDWIPVTADNFVRAETDRTFAGEAKLGAFGKFFHFRDLAPIGNQVVQRGNRYTLYSTAIFHPL